MELIPMNKKITFNGNICYDLQKYLKGNELRLYMYYCQLYNPNYDYAWPSYANIREYFGQGWDNKNIRKYIVGLEEKGFIVVDKNKKAVGFDNNIYRLFTIKDTRGSLDNPKIIKLMEDMKELRQAKKRYEKGLRANDFNSDISNFLINEINNIDNELKDKKNKIEQIKKSLLDDQDSKNLNR